MNAEPVFYGHENKSRVPHRRTHDPLPADPVGQRLALLFPNGWDWIFASAPDPGNPVDWETVKKFPLSPVEMWSHHQDPDCLIGVRPSAQTRWLVLDIDKDSRYHPSSDPEWLPKIRHALEDIGICRSLLCQSSHSGGLHLYLPLPESVSSFWLSVCIKLNLEAEGIKFYGGQCELYPNPKRYVPKGKGYSLFAAFRLPMQPGSGFHPLDADLNPLPWSLETWLEAFELCADGQDMGRLSHAIADAQQNFKVRKSGNASSLATWQERIHEEKQQGWTGPCQTNEKLKIIACEARVFLGMDSPEQIAEYVCQTAQNTPGFNEHCRHQHEIERRSYEVATWAMRYYWPAGSAPTRDAKYHDKQVAPADFGYHQSKREAAQNRIKQAVLELKRVDKLPPGIAARASAIAKLAHTSQKTLYRKSNLELWHPHHLPPEPPQKAPEALQKGTITQLGSNNTHLLNQRKLELLLFRSFLQLYIYVGFVIQTIRIQAAVALAPKGQRAAKAALESSEDLDRGGLGGNSKVIPIQNWDQLHLSLPPGLQQKISNAKRQQKRELELEQRRRQRLKARKSQRKAHSEANTELRPQQEQLPLHLVTTGDQPIERQARLSEREEFDRWYRLAQQCKLVADYSWRDGEYWVLAEEQWQPYSELSAVFTLRAMERMFGVSFDFGDGRDD
ncbi:bifunctional DNA primase/polymerase [Acaryochloris marina]|uniref:Uncharacterized protein n=1 Tax=Acaryochloris marina (strain MBIC 11017) TaxID=329726 RepID=A8ZPS4_ACAM1|nr:hypothetical protein [Acaryochloris marina]ABW33053.1 conserved hypothetical protein [Acaryochloris marina MBIC11017]